MTPEELLVDYLVAGEFAAAAVTLGLLIVATAAWCGAAWLAERRARRAT